MLLPECSLQPLLAPPSHLPSLRVLQICNCQHPHLPKSLAGCRCTPAPGTLEGSTLLPSFGPTSPGLGLLEVWAWLPVKETNRSPLAHPPSSVLSRSPALQRALQGPSQASCPAGGGGGGCQGQSLPPVSERCVLGHSIHFQLSQFKPATRTGPPHTRSSTMLVG